jgi:hypothetical protein
MEFSSQIVPALIVLIANLMSGPHSSLRWEYVTALFGWGTLVFLFLGLASHLLPDSINFGVFFIQASCFCLLTALSRDYEKILRPLFPWNRP